ncbi:MAG TPA: hypothetical protein VJS11_04990 [Acidobacteriaceae bacterium]|nr:hypothetical protein [Acidobacteriaceae bacterium]
MASTTPIQILRSFQVERGVPPGAMTVQEIEAACREAEPPSFEEYYNDAPALTMETMFYPLGFPLRVRSNSEDALRVCRMKWGRFEQAFDTDPMETHIHVVETYSRECPPAPTYRVVEETLLVTADADNVCVAQFPRGKTRMVVSAAAIAHPSYFTQTFLEAASASQLWTRFATPIHAACVALDGRGVLLCGDSGAGKSSLSYACARAGWQFISDDCSYLLHNQAGRNVLGDCHQVRFRPSAAELFPEIADAEVTPRLDGTPSIDFLTSNWPTIAATRGTHVDFIVFLNRREPGIADLVPFSREVAYCFIRQNLFGTSQTKSAQCAGIERLLKAEVLELRYQSLDWAVARLEQLVREGR